MVKESLIILTIIFSITFILLGAYWATLWDEPKLTIVWRLWMGSIIGVLVCAFGAIAAEKKTIKTAVHTNNGDSYYVKETPTEIKKLIEENEKITLTSVEVWHDKPIVITTNHITAIK